MPCLPWAHISFCWFCHAVPHFSLYIASSLLTQANKNILPNKSIASTRWYPATLLIIAPLWKSGGYTGFALSFCHNSDETWISLRPVGQSWSNFWWSIIRVGKRKAALGFGSDWIKTLVSMATESAHWLTMGKNDGSSFSLLFLSDFAGNEDKHKISDEFEFRPDRTTPYRVRCPWASQKFPIDL